LFTDFFYLLRKRKVPVSLTEWMTLMEALSQGLVSNLDDFYYLARAVLVKSETYFDQYDVAFQEFFTGMEFPSDISAKILEWLKDPINRAELTEEEQAMLDMMDFEKLLREFEKRMAEQTEQHDGGNYWVGRGGTSPFGHSGRHPAGIRVGGESRGRGAIQIAQERKFRNYRGDITLDVRQIKMALRRLRHLNRIGPEDELDLDRTIDATAKNAGDVDLKWMRSRKNAVKLLLLMDVGGSMEPFAETCGLLFSAANTSSHFKDLQYYYFHNCVYETLHRDIETKHEEMSTEYLLHTLEPDYKVVLVGDARMAPQELYERWGAIYYYQRNETPGIIWLKRIADHFTHCVWLNPEGRAYWNHPTVSIISKLFPMYELNLDGIGDSMRKLVSKR
jgi:uncharacterized protein with von Willebrand factor type A (vWA) domain